MKEWIFLFGCSQDLVPRYRALTSFLWAAFPYFSVKHANMLVSHIHIPPGFSDLSSLLEKREVCHGNQIDAFPPFLKVNPGPWPKVLKAPSDLALETPVIPLETSQGGGGFPWAQIFPFLGGPKY